MNTCAVLNDNIVRLGRGGKYVKLYNTVGHCYYFPYRHIRAYMSLYQPSSLKGSLAVLFLPVVKRFKCLLPLIRAEIVRMEFDRDFLATLEECFDHKDINCALFCGTPGRHSKPTMLVASADKCIGYCKVSVNNDVVGLFKAEKAALDYLRGKGVENVPEITYCAPYDKAPSLWLFCQTTQRRRKVRIPRIGSAQVLEFVEEMREKTGVEADLADTDFRRVLDGLETLITAFDDKKSRDIVTKTVTEVRGKLSSGKRVYSASHGDLTPWNGFIVDGHFFAFDLEYFKYAYPPYADLFHFFTQSLIFDYYADAALIRERYNRYKQTWFHDIPECDFLYRCYLLSIIWFYLNRENGAMDARLENNLCIWVSLLENLEPDEATHKITEKIGVGIRRAFLSSARGFR